MSAEVSLSDWVQQNKVASALIAVLVLVVILYLLGYRRTGFTSAVPHTRCTGNLWMNGMSPQWQNGAFDAGNWGTIHNSVPVEYVYPYDVGTRAIVRPCYVDEVASGKIKVPLGKVMGAPPQQQTMPMPMPAPAMKEGFDEPTIAEPALWGENDPEFEIKYLQQGPCGYTDTGAAAEVQALTSLGVYNTTPYAADSFQKMVDDTYNLDGGPGQAQWQYHNEMTGGM